MRQRDRQFLYLLAKAVVFAIREPGPQGETFLRDAYDLIWEPEVPGSGADQITPEGG